MRSPKLLLHILLNTTHMSPGNLSHLLSSLGQNAPQSALYKSQPAVQSAVTDVLKAGDDHVKSDAIVAATEGLLASQRLTRDLALAALGRCLLRLKGLVETFGTTAEDAKAMGFLVRQFIAKAVALAGPDGVVFKALKAHGHFTATVHDVLARKHFAAQISVDPIGPNSWIDLPGHGKQRKPLGYASGTTVWVRFAALRGAQRSDWCAPVAFVVP